MIYADYARRKMHNVVKLGTAEGYPLVINNAEGKKLKDYTIEGNTEYGENLFNYTEPSVNSIKADTDGWFDVTINNSTGGIVEKLCCTKVNLRLKPNTTYYITVEISERTGDISLRPHNAANSQFSTSDRINSPDIGVFKRTGKTRASFADCLYMMRTSALCDGGKSGHIKFRIAVYETEKDVFLPYTKTSVGDMTENLFNYTEPLKNSIKADENGWFDVSIDNSEETSKTKYVWCFTKISNQLKVNTPYCIFMEVAERTGDIGAYAVSTYSTDSSQFSKGVFLPSSGTRTTTVNTISDFSNSSNMLRTYCWSTAGKSGHIKFRIAIYETEKGYFEPYNKYKIPIVVSGKNLIPYPYEDTTKTLNGVTFTDNGDGSIMVNGTPTEYSYFMFGVIPIMPSTTFTISKNQSADAANVAFAVRELDENRVPIGTEISIPPTVVTHTFTVTDNTRYIRITLKRWGSNIECKGTFKPMLELGTLKEPQTTIYLNAPLADGESINYKADNLPDIVLNKGSNTITTDTAVKPKKIIAKYYKK